MKRAEAIKDLEVKIAEIENGPEVEKDYFGPGLDAYPKEGLPNYRKALEQYKAMTDEQWEDACQFND